MKKRCWRLLVLLLVLLLCACGGEKDPQPTDTVPETTGPEPTQGEPTPSALPYVNPLTGEGSETDLAGGRPVAIMINNLKKALPQAGVSQADIIYEVVAEGGITRMMAVFQSVEGVGEIGTVRSARDYYVSLALGHDAVFLHAGGSPSAYEAISAWGVTALDCVNGPYEGTLFWRDAERRKNAGLEHSVLTSGEKILELLPTYKKVTLEHEPGYEYPVTFTEDGTPAGGYIADTLTVRFSSYKTGVFHYDRESGKYLVEEYDQPYVDANTGEQVAVTNVLVLFTDVSRIQGDTSGRMSVRTTGSGTGYFACGGQCIEIQWSKKSNDAPLTYTTAEGAPLNLGVGNSYVNIVGLKDEVTFS